ncbi:transposase [Paraburkholderia sp. UYCP14C]|uniref:transposase n=1 Tax=Paraburkholderia sp. UYCP14C TaxID=2511130 RepID=UPI0035A17D91
MAIRADFQPISRGQSRFCDKPSRYSSLSITTSFESGRQPLLSNLGYVLLKYPVTDEQWRLVAHLFEPQGRHGWGRPARDPRVLVDAMLWIKDNNEPWRHLPVEFGPPQTAYIKSLQWRRNGIIDRAIELLSSARERPTNQRTTSV